MLIEKYLYLVLTSFHKISLYFSYIHLLEIPVHISLGFTRHQSPIKHLPNINNSKHGQLPTYADQIPTPIQFPLTVSVIVDEKLTGADKFTAGAILSDTGSPLATSSGFSISSSEGAAIASIIGGTSAPSVSVGGTSYPVVDADAKREYSVAEMLQGVDEVDRVADIHAKSGSNGVIVSTTGKVFIVGVYGEGQNPGSLAPVVKTVVAKLSEKGF